MENLTLQTKMIVLPNHLSNPVFVKGLRQPLEAVAEILDEQGHGHYALSLRDAATVCETFAKVCLEKSDTLYDAKLNPPN